MGYLDEYKFWMTDPYFDEDTRAELKALEGNDKEIEDRFYKNLEFGTAGFRGVIGAGTNDGSMGTFFSMQVLRSSSYRAAKMQSKEALLSHMTHAISLRSSPRSLLRLLQHTAFRAFYLTSSVRFLCVLTQ